MILYSDALAWTLLHFIWQATAIGLVYKCVARRYEICSASTQYNVALVALLSMAAFFSFTGIYECLRLTHLSAGYFPSCATIRQSSGRGLFAEESFHYFQWIDVLWLAGCLLLTIRSIGGQWIHYRTHKNSYFLHSGEVYERFIVLTQRMHLERLVRLRVHVADTGPFVSGVFRSTVYLPLSVVTNLPTEYIEWILMHELAHVQRADYFWNLFQTVMESLFFFHPVVWWLGRTLRSQRELCCDAVVVESCPNPILYAKALLSLAETQYHHAGFAMPATGRHNAMQLLHRVIRILGDASPRERQTSTSPHRNIYIAGLALATLVSFVLIMAPSNFVRHNPNMMLKQSSSSMRIKAPSLASGDASTPGGKTFPVFIRQHSSASLHNATLNGVRPQRPDLYFAAFSAPEVSGHAHRHLHPHEHNHHHRHDDNA